MKSDSDSDDNHDSLLVFIEAIDTIRTHIADSEFDGGYDEDDPWFPTYESLEELKEKELEEWGTTEEEVFAEEKRRIKQRLAELHTHKEK
jgi:hypothetical protein